MNMFGESSYRYKAKFGRLAERAVGRVVVMGGGYLTAVSLEDVFLHGAAVEVDG